MKTSTKVSLGFAVLAVVAGGFFINQRPEEKMKLIVKNPQTITETTLVYPKASGESTKTSTPVVKKELPENPYLNKESLATLPEEMKEFLFLDMKSIKNEEETRNYYSLLRSPEALMSAQKILLSSKSEREHFAATRFLARALGDLNNKSNKALNDIVKRVILEDNLKGETPRELQILFAGDKAELVQTYIAFNPHGHKELLDKAKDANIKKIIENAYAYNLTMRAGN